MRDSRLTLGVLVSGRGTNLQAIIDAIESGQLHADIVLVISNHRAVPAIERAHHHGSPVEVVEESSYESREAHDLAMAGLFERRGVELVVLAGYDRVLHPTFVERFRWKIMNIHPSLLPAFPVTLRAQADALAWGVKVSGATVHFVTEDVDAGPIIVQEAVPVLEGDTVESLSQRILDVEHRLLPQAIQLYAEGRLILDGRRVRILDKTGGVL